MIESIARALQSPGSALDGYAFELTSAPFAELRQIIHVKIYIVGHEQIQPAVVIIVNECGTRRPTRITDPCLLSNVGERAVAVVSQQMVRPQAGDVDIIPAIVV